MLVNYLLADSVKKLLKVLQTTSVEPFNDLFDTMAKQLTNAEIQSSVNPT